jgi:hypothetical protein
MIRMASCEVRGLGFETRTPYMLGKYLKNMGLCAK